VPTFHLIAQKRELDADRFALELTGDWFSRASVSAARCGDLWLPEDPLFDRLYLNTHPSTGKRVRLANEFGEAEASRTAR
jgi:Zn-dependent protease with chaperone function